MNSITTEEEPNKPISDLTKLETHTEKTLQRIIQISNKIYGLLCHINCKSEIGELKAAKTVEEKPKNRILKVDELVLFIGLQISAIDNSINALQEVIG